MKTHAASTHPRFAGLALSALSTAILAACGGGGDSGGSSSGGPIINSGNAVQSAADAYGVMDSFYSAGLTSTEAALDLKSSEAHPRAAAAGGRSFAGIALRRLSSIMAPEGNASGSASRYDTKAVGSASAPCPSGGSITATVNDVDEDGVPSRPDILTFDFANCRSGPEVIHGRMTMTAMDYAETGSSLRIGGTFTFSNLTISDGVTTETGNGDFSIQAQYQSAPVHYYETTISGQRFSMTSNGSTGELRSFSLTGQVNLSGNSFAFTFGATYSEPGRGIRTTLSTPQAFQGYLGAYPHVGMLQVKEIDGSALVLTAVSSTSARIDVDANGDGTPEDSITTTWGQLAR